MAESGKGSARIGRSNRFKLKNEFTFVRANGRKNTASGVLLIAAKPEENGVQEVRYGVICSRRFDKRAVVRNRAKRLLHEAMRVMSMKMEIPPCRILLIPRREILKMKMDAVASQLLFLMKKAQILS